MKEELTSLSESLLSDEDKESLKTGMEAEEQAGEIRENVEEVAKAISDAKDESEPMDGSFRHDEGRGDAGERCDLLHQGLK